MLELFDAEPGVAALCVVDVLGAGPDALERRAEVIDALVGAVDRGRRDAAAANAPQPRDRGGRGGSGAGRPLHPPARAKPKPLLPLRGQLMSMIVLPYLGPEAAAEELARRARRARRRAAHPGGPAQAARHAPHLPHDARADCGRNHPDLNNRRVAHDAGVADQGQMSKLLARLESLGLIVNGGESIVPGEANAWRLTGAATSSSRRSAPVRIADSTPDLKTV